MLFNTSQFLMIWYNSNRNLRQRVHMKLLYNGFWQRTDIPWILILLFLFFLDITFSLCVWVLILIES